MPANESSDQEQSALQPSVPVRVTAFDDRGFEKTVPIHGDLLRVGRDKANGLSIDHPSIAACHLLIVRQGLQYFLADASAGLGVFINGESALKKELNHNDEITFSPDCPYKIKFLTEGTRKNDRERRNLRALLDASRTINSSLVLDEVLERVMHCVMEVTRARHGFLMLLESNGSLKPRVARGIDLQAFSEESLPMSRSVIQEVMESRRSVVVTGGPTSVGGLNHSIIRLKVLAVMCVPILSREEIIGAIYVDHDQYVSCVSRTDVEVLESLADCASVAIENARLTERMLLAERVSSVGRMVSSIVHDFRGPLTSIRVGAELIARDPGGAKTTMLAGRIVGEADRMAAMAQEVLDFCRGRTSITSSRQSIGNLLTDLTGQIEEETEAAGISLVFDLREDTSLLIDSRRMHRVLRNLINNAMDAMREGGVLTIRADRYGERVRICVSDTGCGMAEEVRSRVFEPFFTEGKRDGSGLGMSIAQRIVEAHGGEIRIDSSPGAGTTVTILLPLDGAPEPNHASATATASRA